MKDGRKELSPTARLLGMLGLAKKAGRSIAGTELACDAVRQGRVASVYVACDVSANTAKRITNCCAYYEVPCVNISSTCAELANAIGRGHSTTACVAVTDEGFATAINRIIEDNTEGCKAGAISAGGADNDTKSEIQDQ